MVGVAAGANMAFLADEGVQLRAVNAGQLGQAHR